METIAKLMLTGCVLGISGLILHILNDNTYGIPALERIGITIMVIGIPLAIVTLIALVWGATT